VCCALKVPFSLVAPLLLALPVPVLAHETSADQSSDLAAVWQADSELASPIDSQSWLRHRLCRPQELACFGLVCSRPSPANSDLVVVTTHGFNSHCDSVEPLARGLEVHFGRGRFNYANDQSIEASAKHLAGCLRQLKVAAPKRRVAFVAHSMGGLVVRRVIEDPQLDPGNVSHLIMIAPPNHGSQLARYAVAVDTWEHWLNRESGNPWQRWRDSVVDGLGEAASELVPGSPFLTKLNSRPRNAKVQYTILLGDDAALTRGEMEWIRSTAQAMQRVPGASRTAGQWVECLDNFDECIDGRGDGVVAIERGRLAGVDDVEVLHFGHLSICGDGDAAQRQLVQQHIARRLQPQPGT
jgi:pimeloyl-ACP methyl ester carboxylesterase